MQGHAIDFDTANPATALLTISGNTLTNIAATGIRVRFNVGSPGGSVAITNNTITNVGFDTNDSPGIDLEAAGASNVNSLVDLNSVDTADRAGIAVQSSGTATHSSTIDTNTVSNTSAGDPTRGGINLDANNTSTLNASVQNNVLVNNGAGNGIDASSGGDGVAALVCLDFAGNNSDTGFTLDNNPAELSVLQVEAADAAALAANNTGAFTFNPAVANISFVPVGTCGF